MSTLKDDAARAATLKALKDVVDAEYKTVSERVAAGLVEEKKRTGTSQIAAEVDGEPVASIAWITPDPVPTVTDEEAFRAWVAKHHPHQLERQFVTSVRPAFVTGLVAEMKAAGVAQWCDKATGELHTVPGVTFVGRAAHARLNFRKTGKREVGREAIAEAWRSGRLALPVPGRELEGGE